MNSWVVADSSSLIAAAVEENYSEQAAALWKRWDDTGIQVAVPTLFRYEVVSVIRKHVARGNVTAADGIRIRDELLARTVQTFLSDDLLKRGYELATQFGLPVAYDSQYLAVAEHLNCEFWTLDQRLFNITSPQLSYVKWVGNFPLPQPNE